MPAIRYLLIVACCFAGERACGEELQALVEECEACHGPGGVSSEPDVPSLAGREAAYITAAIEQFYYYERHCPTTTYRHGDRPKTPLNMCNVANTLNDAQKQALAEYFSRAAEAAAADSGAEQS
jgi:cytochrome c553